MHDEVQLTVTHESIDTLKWIPVLNEKSPNVRVELRFIHHENKCVKRDSKEHTKLVVHDKHFISSRISSRWDSVNGGFEIFQGTGRGPMAHIARRNPDAHPSTACGGSCARLHSERNERCVVWILDRPISYHFVLPIITITIK